MYNPILNYVWINPITPEGKPGMAYASTDGQHDIYSLEGQVPLPEHYLDNVFENTNLLQGINGLQQLQTFVWVDFSRLERESIEALERVKGKPEAVSYRDLNEIQPYKEDPLFRLTTNIEQNNFFYKSYIWAQVDFARLVVLEHVLKTTNRPAVYADFDLTVESLCDALTPSRSPLAMQGLVVSSGENQLIGFAPHRVNFLVDELLPNTREAVTRGENGWGAVWGDSSEEFCILRGSARADVVQNKRPEAVQRIIDARALYHLA